MGSDVAPVQDGASVQLYHKALIWIWFPLLNQNYVPETPSLLLISRLILLLLNHLKHQENVSDDFDLMFHDQTIIFFENDLKHPFVSFNLNYVPDWDPFTSIILSELCPWCPFTSIILNYVPISGPFISIIRYEAHSLPLIVIVSLTEASSLPLILIMSDFSWSNNNVL